MDNLREFSTQTVTDFTPSLATGAEAPARLGYYLLERELGRGFSSIVYQATDLQRRRTVALKVLTFLQSLSEDRRADLSQRFQREANAVSALSHPNIVAIFEVGHTEDGRQFIAMEHLAGETLRRRLHQSTPLSVPQATEIAIRVADALHYAHGRGVIHRDVKPDNIFLARGGSAESPVLPKLMDFGIAHVLSDQGQTQDGTIVGSPAYMSPEQINGEALDARTDVFSLAVTLAEMAGGTKPFEGSTIPAVMQQILHHAPDLRRISDRGLQRVLTKALSKNPNGRYPDAFAFAQALRQAVPLANLTPSETTHILEVMPAGLAPPRRLPPIAALGLGAMSLVTLALLPLFTPRPAPPPAPTHLVPGLFAHRHQIDAAWRPASAAPINSFRIAETTPRPAPRFVSAVHPQPTVTHIRPMLPVPPARPTPPSAPTAPAIPAAAPQPLLVTATHSAALQPVPRRPLKSLVLPIVRVAGMRQEMTTIRPAPIAPAPIRPALPTPPETETVEGSDTLPPPREAGLPDAAPHALHRTMPALPDDAPEGFDAQAVRLRVSVNEDGGVDEATVLTSSGSPALDHAALEAVRQWEYDPAIRDGQSVPGVVTEQVTFSPR